MHLDEYLYILEWSQADLAKNAGVASTTISRLLNEEVISRRSARYICIALSEAMGKKITSSDVNELHMSDIRRPQRQKSRHRFRY